MTQHIRVGNLNLEIPDGNSLVVKPGPLPVVKAGKPETPEPLEDTPYIYRPNDALQSQIDGVHAAASISASHPPWVRKTWFVVFILLPLVFGEANICAIAFSDRGEQPLKLILGMNVVFMPVWLLWYYIWHRNVKRKAAK